MYTSNSIKQPAILKVGNKYLMRPLHNNNASQTGDDVEFLSYTISPEVVIVKTSNGQRLLVARQEIYEIREEENYK